MLVRTSLSLQKEGEEDHDGLMGMVRRERVGYPHKKKVPHRQKDLAGDHDVLLANATCLKKQQNVKNLQADLKKI